LRKGQYSPARDGRLGTLEPVIEEHQFIVMSCSLLVGRTLTVDMASLNRLERLCVAALRLREIQSEAAAIYRKFPELDRRPKSGRARRPPIAAQEARPVAWAVKLH